MKKIGLPEKAVKIVKQQVLSDTEFQVWQGLYLGEEKRFYEELDKKEDKRTFALVLFLNLAVEAYKEYKKQGIPDQIYFDTFLDITLWAKECEEKHSEYGLIEERWIGQSVKLNLFRIGRLQFEPGILKKEINGKKVIIPAGTQIINVHIPAGEPLLEKSCQLSFKDANAFFGGAKNFYVCDSWLLSTHLKEILVPESNIICFQNLFDIVDVHYDNVQAEERVFGKVLSDKNEYSENTSLQRKVKAYLLEGKKIGAGIGVRIDS